MNFFIGILSGLREAWAHKFRSALSMLGIILGVASLVAVMGIAEGLIQNFRDFFESQGGIRKLDVNRVEPPEWQSVRKSLSPGITLDDAQALRANVPLAQYVVPSFQTNWRPVEYKGRREWTRFQGVTPEYFVLYPAGLQEGRLIGELDVEHRASVVVIGSRIKDMFFKGSDEPIVGEKIRLGGALFTIVGVREHLEHNRWRNRAVYLPISTAMGVFGEDDKLSYLNVMAADPQQMPALMEQIKNTLLATHRGIHDIEIQTEEEALAQLKERERGFTYSLGSLAVISLLVGGIGIANVMLASINERIREIGVRKAVGARASDIFTQFLAESISIALVGGVLGVIASYAVALLFTSLLPEDADISIVLTPEAFVIGFACSVFTGVIAGIYPAIKAAKLDPITALHYD